MRDGVVKRLPRVGFKGLGKEKGEVSERPPVLPPLRPISALFKAGDIWWL